jgi:uncharacterized membrane protein YbhN (UPF0104 family)
VTYIQAAIRKGAHPQAKQVLKALAVAAILGLAAFLLYRTLSQYTFEEIGRSLARIPIGRFAAALGFAGCSYLLLTGFDWLGLRYVRRPLDWPRTALASFTSLSIGHNLGFAAVSTGALRYRFYSRWGLKAGEIAQVIVFCGVTVGLGLMTVGGVALLLHPDIAVKVTRLSPAIVMVLGIGLLGLVAAYLVLAAVLRRTLTIRGQSIHLPSVRLALAQVGIGAANFACVAAALHQMIAALGEVPYASVAAAYVTANTAGLISHVPGGLGVIESVVAMLLSQGDVIGALVAFRVAYYLIPLGLGALALALSEMFIRKENRVRGRSDGKDPAAR